MTTLLVAKNKESLELLRHIDNLIAEGGYAIENKISQVKKSDGKMPVPALILSGRKVINDINEIYIYLTKRDNGNPYSRKMSEYDDNPYRELEYSNYDDYLDREIEYDDEGRVVKSRDDSEPRRRSREGDDEDDEPIDPANISKMAERFEERRGKKKVPQFRRGKPREDSDDERPYRPTKPPSKSRKSKKYEESSDDSFDSDDSGNTQIEDYMRHEMHSRDD